MTDLKLTFQHLGYKLLSLPNSQKQTFIPVLLNDCLVKAIEMKQLQQQAPLCVGGRNEDDSVQVRESSTFSTCLYGDGQKSSNLSRSSSFCSQLPSMAILTLSAKIHQTRA